MSSDRPSPACCPWCGQPGKVLFRLHPVLVCQSCRDSLAVAGAHVAPSVPPEDDESGQ